MDTSTGICDRALAGRIQRTLAMIREDIRNDVARREGEPFDGRHVGEAMGEICAQVDALAGIIQALVGGESA